MATDKKTYSIPEDPQPAMASEPTVAYSVKPTQDHIILNVPNGIDAEQRFRNALDKWLAHTGVYSGPNLCWDNDHFRQIQSMGKGVITMIDRAFDNHPEYTHRHLGWLKRKLQEV